MRSPRRGSARSPSSSGARRRPATSAPTATWRGSRRRTRQRAPARCRCSSTSASAAPGTICGQHGRPSGFPCSPRASSRPRLTCGRRAKREPTRRCCSCATSTTQPARPCWPRRSAGPRHARRGARRRGGAPRGGARRSGDRCQRARPRDLHDRPLRPARAAGARAARPRPDRRERNRHHGAGGRRRARGGERRARRLDADARARPGGRAARDPAASAREGVRPHAPGGCRRGGRGRRRPRRLHPGREPAPAEALLDAPDTVLRVAVFVGETEPTEADLVQHYASDGTHRARDAALLRGGERVGTVVDLPWLQDDPTHLERARATEGRVMLAGASAPRTSPRRSRPSARGRSTPRGRPSSSPA